MLERLNLCHECVARGNSLVQRWTVLPFQPLQQRQTLFNLLQPCRRGINAGRIVTCKECEIFELPLDGIPQLDKRLEPRLN